MIVHRNIIHCLLILLSTFYFSEFAFAHGGVVEEDDLCVIKVNYLRAHFKIYQPTSAGHKQYCEDLPTATESIFVMEYLHDSLSEMLIDFRIIRDVTGQGRFARIEDIDAIDDIAAVTVYYQPPSVEPDIYTVGHNFVSEGDFIGIVSATHVDTGKTYSAVFPFEVGYTGLGYWPFIVGLLVLVQIQYLFMSGRIRQWFSRNAVATATTLCLLIASPLAIGADVLVSYSTSEGDPEINRMHSWILHVTDAAGLPIEGAEIAVDGGMPEHDHGLPTRPRVTEELGGGDYRLDGVRFHMSGYWELVVRVTHAGQTTTVVLPLQL